ncbi:hypothetical protein B484DRAFT_443489 [Ochromonadaceae sp. CCMP2298]|nr:hypothetical protein B484DRAFT_443489 [Ochromonadaceae sp. CCMP2298]
MTAQVRVPDSPVPVPKFPCSHIPLPMFPCSQDSPIPLFLFAMHLFPIFPLPYLF